MCDSPTYATGEDVTANSEEPSGHQCALDNDGSITCWSASDTLNTTPLLRRSSSVAAPFGQFAIALDHTCAVRVDAIVECWGDNSHGQAPASVSLAQSQSIIFDKPLPTTTTAGSSIDFKSNSTSGLPPWLVALPNNVCRSNAASPYSRTAGANNRVYFLAPGNCTISVSQPGSRDFQPADPVDWHVTVQGTAPVIQLVDLLQLYDGQPKPVTVITNPAGLSYTLSYGPRGSVPTLPGAYTVTATALQRGYSVSVTDTLTITP